MAGRVVDAEESLTRRDVDVELLGQLRLLSVSGRWSASSRTPLVNLCDAPLTQLRKRTGVRSVADGLFARTTESTSMTRLTPVARSQAAAGFLRRNRLQTSAAPDVPERLGMVSGEHSLPGHIAVVSAQQIGTQTTQRPHEGVGGVVLGQELPIAEQVAGEVLGPGDAASLRQQSLPGRRSSIQQHRAIRLARLVAPPHAWAGAVSVGGGEVVAYARDLKPDGLGAQLSVILEVEGRRLWRCVALGDLVSSSGGVA